MKRKVNEFGEFVCICGHEIWDHSLEGGQECLVLEPCYCRHFTQEYE